MATNAFQPKHGDVVIMLDRDDMMSWVLSVFPGPAQLRYHSANAAIDAATRYALHAGLRVWGPSQPRDSVALPRL